jgi:GMP synthase-like glutamine amidotransferase
VRPILLVRNESTDTLGIAPACLAADDRPLVVLDAFDPDAEWPGLEGIAALAVFGGSMNVDQVDAHPYLLRERAFVREAVAERKLPYLGVCLGGQMLARALDAPVTPSPVVEMGFNPVSLTAEGREDPVLSAVPDGDPAFQWHVDTFALPAGAVHLVEGVQVAMQAFRWGPRAWGLQFHPEVTADELDAWIDAEGDGFRSKWGRAPDEVREEIRDRLPAATRWGLDLLRRFAGVVEP